MLRTALRVRKFWGANLLIGLCAIALAQGCNSSGGSGGQSDDNFLKNAEFPRAKLAKFAGKVTVDGQPPKKDLKLFVVLADPQHLDENAHGILPRNFAACDEAGNFGFSTYDRHDGVAAGKYVVTFVELHPKSRDGQTKVSKGGTPVTAATRFVGPDELKNLYSDPDTNIKDTKLFLDLQPPGKEDYHFDLVVKGKEPVPKAAPHALQNLAPKQLDWPPAAASTAK